MVNKDKNNNHSSNSLVLGLWPMAADKITTRNWRGIKENKFSVVETDCILMVVSGYDRHYIELISQRNCSISISDKCR